MKAFLAACAFAIVAGAQAQPAAPAPEWVDADVVRVNLERGRVTLKHARIDSIAMEAMTMQFRVAEPAQLAPLEPGDRIRFAFRNEAGELVITAIEVRR